MADVVVDVHLEGTSEVCPEHDYTKAFVSVSCEKFSGIG
jgi:hypothetical protein